MLKTSSGVRYALYSLASSKPEPGGTMPKDCAAFLSQPGARDIQLYPTGDVRTRSYFVCLHVSLTATVHVLLGKRTHAWCSLECKNQKTEKKKFKKFQRL